jgi:hypothetical protein
VILGLKDPLGLRALRGFKECLVLRVRREYRALRGLKVLPAKKERKATRETREQKAIRATREKVKTAPPAKRATREIKGTLAVHCAPYRPTGK